MSTTSPAPPSAAVIRRALGEFKLPAYDDQVLQIQQYIGILLAWNEKINLTAIRDPLEILYRHICESMYASVAVPVENGRLADVEEVAPLDFVCSRALGEFPAFLEWANSQQIAAKQVILWIGARDLPEIQKNRTWDWAEPIQVPNSLRRLLLVGTKNSPVVDPST